MNLTVTAIPYGHIHEIIEYVIPFIKKAAKWSMGRMETDDILKAIFNRSVILWLVFDQDDKSIHGFLTTEIRQYSFSKQFCVLNCGGKEGSLEACVDTVFDTFEEFAQANGCDAIEIEGRAAWSKFIKSRGYDTEFRHYFKKLGG